MDICPDPSQGTSGTSKAPMGPQDTIVFYSLSQCSDAQSCLTLCNTWTVACQAPLFMGLFMQEYWSGVPFLPLGDLPEPAIKPVSLVSPALAGGFFTTSANCEALILFISLFLINFLILKVLFLKPLLYSFMYFWPHCAACQILVPQPGIKQVPPSLEAPSLNLWTAGMSQDAVLVQGILKIIPEDLGQVWDSLAFWSSRNLWRDSGSEFCPDALGYTHTACSVISRGLVKDSISG